jgi:hypothetical protein
VSSPKVACWIVIPCWSTSVLIHTDLLEILSKLYIRKQIKFCILAVLGVGFFPPSSPTLIQEVSVDMYMCNFYIISSLKDM